MNRRQVLYGVLGLAALPSLSLALTPTAERVGNGVRSLADCLLQACPRRASAAAVGNAYLQGLEKSPKTSEAVHQLLAKLEISPSDLVTMRPNEVTASVRARMSHDFRAGNVARVRGWVLSETEAELCGLAALLDEVA